MLHQELVCSYTVEEFKLLSGMNETAVYNSCTREWLTAIGALLR